MPVSKKQQMSVAKYKRENYERVDLSLHKGEKDKIKAAAEAAGLSLNAYIVNAVKAYMCTSEVVHPPAPIVEGANGGSDVSDHPKEIYSLAEQQRGG